MNYSDWSIRSKLLSAFGILLVLMLITNLIAVRSLGNLNAEVDNIANEVYPETTLANGVVKRSSEIGRLARSGILDQGAKDVEADIKKINEIRSSTGLVVQATNDISGSLGEQRSAAGELSRNVESIAQMSEENSAAVEAVAENAQKLLDTSQSLKAGVARFQL